MNKNDEEASNNETMDEVDTVGFYMCPDGQATDHYRLVEDHLPTISQHFPAFFLYHFHVYVHIFSIRSPPTFRKIVFVRNIWCLIIMLSLKKLNKTHLHVYIPHMFQLFS